MTSRLLWSAVIGVTLCCLGGHAGAESAVLGDSSTAPKTGPSASAQLLVSQGRSEEAAGRDLVALRRYADAIDMDVSFEDAYLALGALRLRRGELAEAEHVFSAAIARSLRPVRSHVARAKVRRLADHLDDAMADLTRARAMQAYDATADELGLLREMAQLARAQRQPAGEIAVWRRILAVAVLQSDETLRGEALLQVRVLGRYLRDVDPVPGARGAGWELRGLARAAIRLE